MFIRIIFKALKPFPLIALIMTYVMGAGLVAYVRVLNNWSVFILGGIFLLLIAIAVELLRLMQSLVEPKSWPEGMSFRESKQVRIIIAAIAATLFTVGTAILITWILTGVLWQGLVFLLLTLLAVGGLYYFSQVNKHLRPYNLLLEVLLYVVIPPAMAYFLQANDLHRYLTMVVISFVPAYLANRLLHLLQSFGSDQKNDVDTLVIRIGWQNAMFYHNALILLSYFLFALIAVLGVHWVIIWPVFLTLPIGLLEIWLMERIRRGMPPLWAIMRFAVACVFFIPVYLIGFGFWFR